MGATKADWAAIETDYITSKLSCRELAEKYDISESQMSQRCAAGKWPKKRREWRKKTVEKAAEKISNTAAGRLAALGTAAEALSAALAVALKDDKQLYTYLDEETTEYANPVQDANGDLVTMSRRVVDRVHDKIDTRAAKDMAQTIKDLAAVIRNLYNLPTQAQQHAQDLAEERLDLDWQRLALDQQRADRDNTGGVVIKIAGDVADDYSG